MTSRTVPLRDHLEGPVTAAGGSALPAYDPSGSTSDPFGPYAVWFATDSELTALGFNLGNPVDGTVELNSNLSEFTFSPTDRAVSGEYDAIGALEHEISEVMGRVAYYPAADDGESLAARPVSLQLARRHRHQRWGSVFLDRRWHDQPRGIQQQHSVLWR